MSSPLLLMLVVGAVFLAGAMSGWRARGTVTPQPGPAEDDELLAAQLRTEMLRASMRTAHERTASLELDLTAALMTTTHLEIEVDRLTQAVEEAEAEAASASAWARRVWRERAISQGAARRHPSAPAEERATPPELAPRPIALVRREAEGPVIEQTRSEARWN